MSTFPRFTSLPPELRLMIWHAAAREPHRIIKLDANIEGFFCWKALSEETESVLVTAFFFPQRQRPLDDLVWPPTSQQTVSSLSAACRESRRAILGDYPDTIPLGSQCPYPHPIMTALVDVEGNYPRHHPPPIVGKRLKLRCNFKRDIFFFRQVRAAWVPVWDDISLAGTVYKSSKIGGSRWTRDADDSRALLKRIQNLMIPSFDNNIPGDMRANRDKKYSTFLAATSNLERLYRCPRDNLFVDKDIKVEDFAHEAWESKRLSGATLADLNEARDIYNGITGRLLSPACRTFSAAVIAETGRLVDEEMLGLTAYPDVWKTSFAARLATHGFSQGQLPGRKLKMKPASSRDARSTEEAIWLPQPGYISEKQVSSG